MQDSARGGQHAAAGSCATHDPPPGGDRRSPIPRLSTGTDVSQRSALSTIFWLRRQTALPVHNRTSLQSHSIQLHGMYFLPRTLRLGTGCNSMSILRYHCGAMC